MYGARCSVLESIVSFDYNNHWRVNKSCSIPFTSIYSTSYYFPAAFIFLSPSHSYRFAFDELRLILCSPHQRMYANVFDCASWIQDYQRFILMFCIHWLWIVFITLATRWKMSENIQFIYLPRWYQTRAIQRFNAIHMSSTPKWIQNGRARRRRENKSFIYVVLV